VRIESDDIALQTTVSITPSVALDNADTHVGSEVTATGTGFAAGATITATTDGAGAATDPSPLVAGSQGGFSVKVTVPPGAAGSHTLSFTDNVNTAGASYDIAPATPTLLSDAGHVGDGITIAGTGFSADSPITVTYDGTVISTTPAEVVSTTLGGFQATLTIPASEAGEHVVTASDASGNTIRVTVEVESSPPSAPTLATPADQSRIGRFGPERPAFTWSEVSDLSGVTYTLQVFADEAFTGQVVKKEGLGEATYELAEEEALGRGSYFWRVMAIDGASNESSWSQTFTLTVGFLPAWMPLWLFIVAIVLGVGIIGGIAYLIWSNRPIY
jgi:hypothetical protein